MNSILRLPFLVALILGAFTAAATAESALDDPRVIDALVTPYLDIQAGLAGDDLGAAQAGAEAFLQSLDNQVPEGASAFRETARTIAGSDDIEAARKAFLKLSNALIERVRKIGVSSERELYLAHCPMAFGYSGGDWIQDNEAILNPYEGSRMLRCGGIQEQLADGARAPHEGTMKHPTSANSDQAGGCGGACCGAS